MELKKQLVNNLEYVFDEYYNCIQDDEFQPLSKAEAVEYAKGLIFDMKVVGGQLLNRDKICENLKFLGNELIVRETVDAARRCGVLAE